MTDESIHNKTSWGAAIVSTLLIFVVAMDQVMMPIATSAIARDFSTNAGTIQAIISLVSLVAAPLYIAGGKLGDIHGKKKIFLVGLVLYGIGTLTAALAPNAIFLMGGWSVVRGIAMVLTIPASIGLLMASYPDEAQRGQAFAIYGVGGVAAALVGPLLMGLSADLLSWRVPFGLETVVVAATCFLALRWATDTPPIAGAKIDWGGTVMAFFSVASVILGSMLGGRYGWWMARRPFLIGDTQINPFGLSPAPTLIALGLVVGAFLLGRLYRIEERNGQPLFSMKLFDNRTFLVASVTATIFFVLNGAIPFIIPVFLQQAVGFNGLQTALTMMSFSIGSIVLGFASGSLMQRMQARTLLQLFMLVVAAGIVWLFVTVSLNVTLGQLLLPMLVTGAGFGVITAQLPNIQVSTLRPDLQGEGSGFAETGKELGIGLGTAVIGSIMFGLAIGGFVDDVARQAELPLTPAQRAESIVLIEDQAVPDEALALVSQRVPDLEGLGKQAYVESFQATLGVLVGVLLMALLAASFIPKVEPEEATASDIRESVADVSSRRL